MSKKELVGNRRYTAEFKVEAVRLGDSIGGNQAAKRLGMPESSLGNWIRLSRAATAGHASYAGSANRVFRSSATNGCAIASSGGACARYTSDPIA